MQSPKILVFPVLLRVHLCQINCGRIRRNDLRFHGQGTSLRLQLFALLLGSGGIHRRRFGVNDDTIFLPGVLDRYFHLSDIFQDCGGVPLEGVSVTPAARLHESVDITFFQP